MASDLTRLQIVTKAADAMGRSLSSTTRSGSTTQSVLEEMYEWSQLRLARAYSFPELDVRDTTTADTVADTKTYSFATLFGASARVKDILSVVIEDGTSSRKLKRLLMREFYHRHPYPEAETSRKPVYYCRVSNSIDFFPVPDAVYDIHTIRSDWPTRATGDSYQSQFEYKDDLLIVGTIVEFFNFFQEFNDAARWNRIWKQKLIESIKPIIHPKDWSPEGRAFNSSVLTPGDFWKDPLQFDNI